MDFAKINWIGDFMSEEMYGNSIDEFTVGLYSLKECPEITLYINIDEGKIVQAFLEDEIEEICLELPQYLVNLIEI